MGFLPHNYDTQLAGYLYHEGHAALQRADMDQRALAIKARYAEKESSRREGIGLASSDDTIKKTSFYGSDTVLDALKDHIKYWHKN